MDPDRPTPLPAIPDFLEALAPVLAAETPESALPVAARLLVGATGATAGGFLLGRADRARAEAWDGDPVVAAALRRRVATASTPDPGTPVDDALAHVHIVPLHAGARTVGQAALAFGPGNFERGAMLADRLLAILGGHWATNADLAEVRASTAQQERWFGVMDAQLRVLDRERQKFVAVVNQSDTHVFVVDEACNVPWMNQFLLRQFDLSEEEQEARGVTLEDVCRVIGMAYPTPETCPVARVFRDGTVLHEEPAPAPGAPARNLFVRYLPIQGSDGRPAEVLVTVQDLSDLEILRRSEARYRHLFEHSPDAMLMVEPETAHIVVANRVATQLLGWTAEELAGLDVRRLHAANEWDEARAAYELVRDRDEALLREWTVLGRDGQRVAASVSLTRFDLEGRVVTLLEIRDVTATKRLEAELRHSQKMEAVGRLAGGVAHDFNNLLSVILGKTELLAGRTGVDAKTNRALEIIRRSALRGSLLTRKLLAFSRKEVVKEEVLDLGGIVKDIEELFGNLLGENITLRTERKDDCMVRGDRGQMEQVLMNLVVNARDAMPAGGTITVRVHPEPADAAAPDAPHVLLEVEDEGVGMDRATQARLFEPFFTTKPRGEGTGLGLSTVYGIVSESRGGIRVDSAPGAGTRFVVRLPRVACALPAGMAALPAVSRPRPEAGGRILLVEDEEEVRAMAAEALEIQGYAVTVASNAEEALRIWKDSGETFQLLLTDVIMPGLSGGELAERVRRLRPATKVLYMSGYNDDAIVRYGVSVSEADFLQKPFTLDSLARKVRGALETAGSSAGTGAS